MSIMLQRGVSARETACEDEARRIRRRNHGTSWLHMLSKPRHKRAASSAMASAKCKIGTVGLQPCVHRSLRCRQSLQRAFAEGGCEAHRQQEGVVPSQRDPGRAGRGSGGGDLTSEVMDSRGGLRNHAKR